MSIGDRLWSKINITNSCWNWTASTDKDGYGQFRKKKDGRWTMAKSHRVVYESIIGKIDQGMVLDHICENKKCVNPLHMQKTNHGDHMRRHANNRTNCRRGHEKTTENTYTWNENKYCLKCRLINMGKL